jgi:hypothetical protein
LIFNRAFGVELEFNTDGRGSVWLRELLMKNNIKIVREFVPSSRGWRLGYDGSEFELKSPILKEEEGFEELKFVMNLLNSNGCRTNNNDGMHVHHDAPEFVGNHEHILRLVKSWHFNQDTINEFVAPRRRTNRSACLPWALTIVEDLEKGLCRGEHGRRKEFGRRSINVDSLQKYGTIEIRLHEGTLNYEVAEAWIKFCQKFINSIAKRKRPIQTISEQDLLLKRIRVAKGNQKVLLKKAKTYRYDD